MTQQFSKLDKAKTQLVLDHPFFASILARRELILTENIPSARVNRRGQIYINPKWIESLTVAQVVYLLAHEVMHVALQHASRIGSREPKRWNLAGDAVINGTLSKANVGEFIPGGIQYPGAENMSTEDMYALVMQQFPMDSEGKGKGKGEGNAKGNTCNEIPDPDGEQEGIGEDLDQDGEPLTEGEQNEVDGHIRVEIAEAMQTAKVRGKLPGVLEKFATELINVKTPWYEILERYMVAFTAGEISWRRANRRYQDVYLPSVGKVQRMGRIGMLTDISGSVSKQEIQHYNGHMKRIIELCVPDGVYLAYCDTHVQHEDLYTIDELDDVQVKFYSGGGTNMVTGLDHMADSGHEMDVVVVLTDGYTPFPADGSKYPWPVIWCISSEVKAPEKAGMTVHFEVERD